MKVSEEEVDKFIFIANGSNKMSIKLPKTKEEDIAVGNKFYHYNTDLSGVIETITITYIRAGVAFYSSDLVTEEQYFPLGCLMMAWLEPEFYESDLNTKYYEIESSLGKTIIRYV